MLNRQKLIILSENINSLDDLAKLKKNYRVWETRDLYENQLIELFQIKNPSLIRREDYQTHLNNYLRTHIKSTKLQGSWIYYHWNGELIHITNERDFFDLRTNRNQNLILKKEQEKIYNSCIGIIGLSVGSAIAVGCVYQGIGKNIKLAEFDTLDTTNLNRVRASIQHLGLPKINITQQQIYEINPYNKLHLYADGLTKKNLLKFIHNKPRPKVIFEIIDDFEMKILLRLEARKAGIPVIMFSNLGDSILIDIERYDKNRNLPIFNGLIGNLTEEILINPNKDKNIYAVNLVGKDRVPLRAMQSLKEIGKTLVGRPQLYSTVNTSGALGVYYARQIILNKKIDSGRYSFKIDEITKNS